MRYYPELDAKEEICEVGRLLFEKGYVVANDGNISIRLSENEVITTPTGVSKGYLKPDMLVKVDLTGRVLTGNFKPSTDLKMHLRIYQERRDAHSVIHAHPPFATAFAVAGIPLDIPILPESIVKLGAVPIVEYGTPSTDAIADTVAQHLEGRNAVLLENHGAVTWGSDVFSAFFHMERLEFTANVTYLAKQLGNVHQLSSLQVKQLMSLKDTLGGS